VHSAAAVNVIATRSAAADAGAGAPPAGSSRLDDTLLERSKLAVKKSA
jgi:hypothetical protein